MAADITAAAVAAIPAAAVAATEAAVDSVVAADLEAAVVMEVRSSQSVTELIFIGKRKQILTLFS